jgi:hypothetical protein
MNEYFNCYIPTAHVNISISPSATKRFQVNSKKVHAKKNCDACFAYRHIAHHRHLVYLYYTQMQSSNRSSPCLPPGSRTPGPRG